jgi:hypothetical protein
MNKLKLLQFFVGTVMFLIGANIFSQWNSDPNVNLQVCEQTNDQVLPKISNTSDGGCYIAWFDTRAGGYRVYLQRLNAQGVKQFSADGLLVSQNPNQSSLVDWDMITDDNDNAVLAFCDIRNSTLSPCAYRINPAGNFLWGNNGVVLATDNSTYQPNPKISKTSDGNFVFVWIFSSTPNKVAMQKLNGAGAKQWGTDPLYLTGTGSENFTYPAVIPSDNGSVIMMWSGYTGSFISPSNYKLYSQKFSSAGAPVWNATQDTVYSLGRVSGFYVPKLYSDGNNGAFYAWQDDRASLNTQSSFVQHATSTGTKLFPINGAEGTTLQPRLHLAPTVCYMPSTGETFMFWNERNTLQSLNGIYGQKFSSNGTRQWGDTGKVFLPWDGNSMAQLNCAAKDTGVAVYYINIITGGTNCTIKSYKTDRNGVLQWGGSIITPSSLLSNKLHLVSTMDASGMSKLAWEDTRSDGGGIYAQNINWDGTYGVPVGINPINGNVPDKFSLSQNFPNPFNPSTKITFNLPFSTHEQGKGGNLVKLLVYDALGRLVSTIVNTQLQAGSYEVTWNADNIPSGVYFYTLTAGSFKESKSMILLK